MASLAEQVERFNKDGYLVMPRAVSGEEVAVLRRGLERAFAEPSEEAAMYNMPEMWRPKMFERGAAFEAMVDHAATADFMEAVLGEDCHLIANSALRTVPGKGIASWHADETVRSPRPAGVPLDGRVPMPAFVVNCNIYLCDVDEKLGPTEFIPGSQRSGRSPMPEDFAGGENPTYEGRGKFSAVGPAGTIVLWNDQTWHRGAINQSEAGTRWVLQAAYGRRWIAQRFYPFINYRLPEGLLERCNPRRARMLGMHKIGAYG